MPFEHGSISIQIMRTAGRLPEDVLDRFAAHAAQPLDKAGNQVLRGWVTGRHLLDSNILRETTAIGGYYRLTLRETVKRIPPALLRAECRMEELAAMAAAGRDRLPPRERRAIRHAVEERLLPNMPPQIQGIPMVCPERGGEVLTGAMAAGRRDAFCAFFQSCTGVPLHPLTPERAALEDHRTDVRDWPAASFSPDLPNEEGGVSPGREFLTWLWYASERPAEVRERWPAEAAGVLIEGPLVFVREGDGAHELTLRKGDPVGSAEARLALLGGKQLARAKVSLALDADQTFTFHWDAGSGIFRQCAFPEIRERLDARSLFEERIRRLERMQTAFHALFGTYVALRNDRAAWAATLQAMQRWIRERDQRF